MTHLLPPLSHPGLPTYLTTSSSQPSFSFTPLPDPLTISLSFATDKLLTLTSFTFTLLVLLQSSSPLKVNYSLLHHSKDQLNPSCFLTSSFVPSCCSSCDNICIIHPPTALPARLRKRYCYTNERI